MRRLGRAASTFFGALDALDWIALAALLVVFVVGVALYLWRLVF